MRVRTSRLPLLRAELQGRRSPCRAWGRLLHPWLRYQGGRAGLPPLAPWPAARWLPAGQHSRVRPGPRAAQGCPAAAPELLLQGHGCSAQANRPHELSLRLSQRSGQGMVDGRWGHGCRALLGLQCSSCCRGYTREPELAPTLSLRRHFGEGSSGAQLNAPDTQSRAACSAKGLLRLIGQLLRAPSLPLASGGPLVPLQQAAGGLPGLQ